MTDTKRTISYSDLYQQLLKGLTLEEILTELPEIETVENEFEVISLKVCSFHRPWKSPVGKLVSNEKMCFKRLVRSGRLGMRIFDEKVLEAYNIAHKFTNVKIEKRDGGVIWTEADLHEAVISAVIEHLRSEHGLPFPKFDSLVVTKDAFRIYMETVEGENLLKIIKNFKSPNDAVFESIMAQIIFAIVKMNDLGFVHNRLSVLNIIVCPTQEESVTYTLNYDQTWTVPYRGFKVYFIDFEVSGYHGDDMTVGFYTAENCLTKDCEKGPYLSPTGQHEGKTCLGVDIYYVCCFFINVSQNKYIDECNKGDVVPSMPSCYEDIKNYFVEKGIYWKDLGNIVVLQRPWQHGDKDGEPCFFPKKPIQMMDFRDIVSIPCFSKFRQL